MAQYRTHMTRQTSPLIIYFQIKCSMFRHSDFNSKMQTSLIIKIFHTSIFYLGWDPLGESIGLQIKNLSAGKHVQLVNGKLQKNLGWETFILLWAGKGGTGKPSSNCVLGSPDPTVAHETIGWEAMSNF